MAGKFSTDLNDFQAALRRANELTPATPGIYPESLDQLVGSLAKELVAGRIRTEELENAVSSRLTPTKKKKNSTPNDHSEAHGFGGDPTKDAQGYSNTASLAAIYKGMRPRIQRFNLAFTKHLRAYEDIQQQFLNDSDHWLMVHEEWINDKDGNTFIVMKYYEPDVGPRKYICDDYEEVPQEAKQSIGDDDSDDV